MSLNRLSGELLADYEYQFNGGVSAPMGQHGEMAYIGCDDYMLYAMHIGNVALRWRFFGGAPIQRQPAVTDRDVFATPRGRGLYRVDRDTGSEQWRNHRAERLLAVNQRFVYATDRIGKLLVLDYQRGNEMAQYDLSDYTVPITNEWNDRLYFASQDGQILCLYQRDNLTPFRTKNVEIRRPIKPKEEKKIEKEEKKEEKMDEKKDEKKEEKKDEKKDERKDEKREDEKLGCNGSCWRHAFAATCYTVKPLPADRLWFLQARRESVEHSYLGPPVAYWQSPSGMQSRCSSGV